MEEGEEEKTAGGCPTLFKLFSFGCCFFFVSIALFPFIFFIFSFLI